MVKIIRLATLLLVIAVSVTACAPAAPINESPASLDQGLSEVENLKIAVLPIVDNLPMYVAQQEGYFEKYGVNVEFIPVASAAERDQVIAAGQADGMINEIISTLLYNQETIQVQIVRFARIATPESAQYHIIVAAKSNITLPSDLKNVEIGISEGTIIEYITDRLLEAEGLAQEEIKTIAVPKIPDRMALLASGELKAATLPDPLSYLAVQQGASILLQDSGHPEYGHSAFAFRKAVIDEKPEAIRGFLAAIEDAVAAINADPQKWLALLAEQKLVPEPLIESYTVPPFPTKSIPSQALWDDVLAWAKGEELVKVDVAYQDSVTAQYLPE